MPLSRLNLHLNLQQRLASGFYSDNEARNSISGFLCDSSVSLEITAVRLYVQLWEDIGKRDGKNGPCVENHPSIYSSVAFHLKKAMGQSHFHCVGKVSSYILKRSNGSRLIRFPPLHQNLLSFSIPTFSHFKLTIYKLWSLLHENLNSEQQKFDRNYK